MLAIDDRNGGRAAVIGAASLAGLFGLMTLGTTGVVPALRVLEDVHWFFHIFEAAIMAALTVGILALYRAQRHSFGKLGKAGAYLGLFGFGYGVVGGAVIIAAETIFGLDTAEGFLDFLAHFPGFFPQMIGSMLFGIATLRAHILPRAAAWLLAIGAGVQLLIAFIPAPQAVRMVPLMALCLGWALLGYALATGGRERRLEDTREAALTTA